VLACVVLLIQHTFMPLPPHSSHDGFMLIPQLKHLLAGAVPDDAHFGMFHSTWFSPHALPTGPGGLDAFVQRIFGNVQSHTWIDAPHPILLMALTSSVLGGGTLGPVLIQLLYLGVLVFSLYAIGAKTHSAEAGLMAGVLALGAPAVFGTVQYIEPHLALASVSTAVVALLLHTDGLRRIGLAFFASVSLWSLSRTGEGSGDAVIAGLVVVGPFVATIIQSDRELPPLRWLCAFLALVLPALFLMDLSWCVAAMERVTRAFADPMVQTDVVEKGGGLAHPLAWLGAYGVLLMTDYLRPGLMALVVAGWWGLRGVDVKHRGVLLCWTLIPWVALSWMQRKAAWYGIVLVPPVLLWAGVGLQRLGWAWMRRLAFLVAVSQVVLFSAIPADRFPSGLSVLREPLQLHEWRLRRIDLLRPMDSVENRRVRQDLDALIHGLKRESNPGPVALMTMGTRSDYAARYYLSMNVEGLEVINLGDPRVRASGYRSLHPDDFSAFLFLDDGAQPWPPDAAQRVWLKDNLRCRPDERFDAFIQAVFSRAGHRQSGFYPLGGSVGTPLSPGQVWLGSTRERGICEE